MSTVCRYTLCTLCMYSVLIQFLWCTCVCFLQDKPSVRHVGGLGWDVKSEFLLSATVVVIMAITGISGVYALASLIIMPWFSGCQFTVQTSSQEFPLLSHC